MIVSSAPYRRRRETSKRICTYAWYIVVIADALLQEPIANLPGEDRRALSLVVGDFVDHRRRRHPRLAAADRSRLDRTGLVIPAGGERSRRSLFSFSVNNITAVVSRIANLRFYRRRRSLSGNVLSCDRYPRNRREPFHDTCEGDTRGGKSLSDESESEYSKEKLEISSRELAANYNYKVTSDHRARDRFSRAIRLASRLSIAADEESILRAIPRVRARGTYLPRILETQPLLTCSMRDMSHGLAPLWASSTIFCLVESGRGRPLT
jgi:hypothetical protein